MNFDNATKRMLEVEWAKMPAAQRKGFWESMTDSLGASKAVREGLVRAGKFLSAHGGGYDVECGVAWWPFDETVGVPRLSGRIGLKRLRFGVDRIDYDIGRAAFKVLVKRADTGRFFRVRSRHIRQHYQMDVDTLHSAALGSWYYFCTGDETQQIFELLRNGLITEAFITYHSLVATVPAARDATHFAQEGYASLVQCECGTVYSVAVNYDCPRHNLPEMMNGRTGLVDPGLSREGIAHREIVCAVCGKRALGGATEKREGKQVSVWSSMDVSEEWGQAFVCAACANAGHTCSRCKGRIGWGDMRYYQINPDDPTKDLPVCYYCREPSEKWFCEGRPEVRPGRIGMDYCYGLLKKRFSNARGVTLGYYCSAECAASQSRR